MGCSVSAAERYTLESHPWACPTAQELQTQIDERIEKWAQRDKDSILALMGIGQFGPAEKPRDVQLTCARDFWSSYVGNCCCCGGSVHSKDEQPSCGHIYCALCIGRGHEEDCLQGDCEGLT